MLMLKNNLEKTITYKITIPWQKPVKQFNSVSLLTVCGHLFYQQLNGLFVREQIDNIRANDARATPRIHSLKC